MTFRFDIIYQYIPALWTGLQLTLLVAVSSIALGILFGVVVAAGRLSPILPIRLITTVYIEIMRGTPMLIQLVWVYFAIPILFGLQLPALVAVVLALTLNAAAFYGEAMRSGIQAVLREYVETANVLGLGYFGRLRYVILPQAFRTVLPVLLSVSISLFKDTSLISTLGVSDLMYVGRNIASDTYRPLEILTTVAIIYFVIAFPTTLVVRRLELHLARHRVAA
jgi:polar amino acid transport system permease protein